MKTKPRIVWNSRWSCWMGADPKYDLFVLIRRINQLNWEFRRKMSQRQLKDILK